MIIPILLVVLALVLGGCVCVVWAARGGGPRWVRAAATLTLAAGNVVRSSAGGRRSDSNGNTSGDD
ncbi:hypothetical protein [Streptomyces sp. NPDC004134]|uniref:hypothetical protein n=1 Tax=Streptomyces sp. NPDC004134 TaxID=3364691 RepID=UPI0036B97E36